MPSITNWGRRQLQDLRPYVDAVHEWRTIRRWDKEKAKREKAERARKSLEEEWLQVSRRSYQNNDELFAVRPNEEESSTQGQRGPRTNADRNKNHTAEYMYIDDIEPEYRQSQQEQEDPERLWQEHIVKCLMRESSLRSQDRSNLWDQVQEEFESGAGLEPKGSSTPEIQASASAERQARRHAQMRQKAFEETYREREGLQFETRRREERNFRAASF